MAGTTVRNFTPAPGSTVSLAVTTGASANVQLAPVPLRRKDLRIVNAGTNTAFFRLGADNTVTASATTDMPVRAGADVLIHAADYTWIAAISTGGNTSLFVTSGFGN